MTPMAQQTAEQAAGNGTPPLPLAPPTDEEEFKQGWDSAEEADKEPEESQQQRAEQANRDAEEAAAAEQDKQEAAPEPEKDEAPAEKPEPAPEAEAAAPEEDQPEEEEAEEAAAPEADIDTPDEKGGSTADEPPAWASTILDRLEKLESGSSPAPPAAPPEASFSPPPAAPPPAPAPPPPPIITPDVQAKLRQFEEVEPEAGEALRSTLEFIGSKVQRLEGDFHKQQATQNQQYAIASVTAAHPDWQEINASPEFKQWFDGQTPLVQERTLSENPQDVNDVLAYYKATTGYTAQQEQPAAEEPAKPDVAKQAKIQMRKAVSTPRPARAAAQKQNVEQTFEEAFEATSAD